MDLRFEMRRWWIYQRERFPVVGHGVLIGAFCVCAVSFSAMLRGAERWPGWEVYGVAFGVCFLMFLQLRIADEFKDAEEDARWRPYRAVPRGLVKLSELRVVFVGACVLQGLMTWWLEPWLLLVLLAAWVYLGLMSVEFFCRDWLNRRPVVYLVSHMGIMPLVDFFGTACDWLPMGAGVPAGLGWFLTASFFNGIVIEVGRKLRLPDVEEEGVETYSRLWGMRGGVLVWLVMMGLTMGCAVMAGMRIGFVGPLAVGLGLVLGVGLVVAVGFVMGRVKGKGIEVVSGLWTLVLYLMLGLVPLWLRLS